MRLNKISLAAMLLGGSAFLAACGGSAGGSELPTAKQDVTAAVTSSTVQAMLDKSFTFESGVPALGTTSSTTIALSGSATSTDFSLTSSPHKATGKMTYGSCIFEIVTSNFPVSFAKLQEGVKTEIKPCDVKLNTNGLTVGTHTTFMKWLLGVVSSISLGGITVTISNAGLVTINGTPFGTITFTVTPATGATGATGGTGAGGSGSGTF